MQITIVQAEIVAAIIAHIKTQVAIRDDQEITVDLRATRGPEGYQAEIDIHPKGQSSALVETKVVEEQAKPLGIEKAVVEAAAKSEPKKASKEAKEPVKQEEPATQEEVAAEVVEQPAEEKPVERAPLFSPKPATDPAAEETNNEPTGSIFGSLKKPVND